MTAKINGWGLIGTGRIAEDRILPGINACAGNKLVAVVSRDQGRADAYAKKFGAQHAYTRYEDMLSNPEVTVVAVEIGLLTPPFGLSVYVIKSTLNDPRVGLGDIFRGTAPFTAIMFVVLLLLIAFPRLSLVLL